MIKAVDNVWILTNIRYYYFDLGCQSSDLCYRILTNQSTFELFHLVMIRISAIIKYNRANFSIRYIYILYVHAYLYHFVTCIIWKNNVIQMWKQLSVLRH